MKMTRRTWGIFAGAACVMLAVGGWMAFKAAAALKEKQAIQAVLEERAAALSRKDLVGYLSCFSIEYRSGERTYQDLRLDAENWFAQFDAVQFSFRTLNIELDAQRAQVENEYQFILNPPQGQPVRIANRELLELSRGAGGWKITASLGGRR